MHIPDGFLSPEISLVFWIISLITVSFSFKNLRKNSLKKIFLFASLGALIFVSQMLNFPVLNGTSGHLIGGALIALLLGFDAAVIIMASVLFIQAVIFHDGGIIALGANVFNMAIVTPFTAIKIKESIKENNLLAVFFAGIVSVVLASFFVSLQLYFSGASGLFSVMNSMLSIHFLIGLAEAILSVALYCCLTKNFISLNPKKILFVSLVVALILVPFASAFPDGLEKTAEKLEFNDLARNSMTPLTVMADYLFPGIENELIAASLAGFFGALIVFSFVFFAVYCRRCYN
jgi:cobalt/nickel transport system permease protein